MKQPARSTDVAGQCKSSMRTIWKVYTRHLPAKHPNPVKLNRFRILILPHFQADFPNADLNGNRIEAARYFNRNNCNSNSGSNKKNCGAGKNKTHIGSANKIQWLEL